MLKSLASFLVILTLLFLLPQFNIAQAALPNCRNSSITYTTTPTSPFKYTGGSVQVNLSGLDPGEYKLKLDRRAAGDWHSSPATTRTGGDLTLTINPNTGNSDLLVDGQHSLILESSRGGWHDLCTGIDFRIIPALDYSACRSVIYPQNPTSVEKITFFAQNAPEGQYRAILSKSATDWKDIGNVTVGSNGKGGIQIDPLDPRNYQLALQGFDKDGRQVNFCQTNLSIAASGGRPARPPTNINGSTSGPTCTPSPARPNASQPVTLQARSLGNSNSSYTISVLDATTLGTVVPIKTEYSDTNGDIDLLVADKLPAGKYKIFVLDSAAPATTASACPDITIDVDPFIPPTSPTCTIQPNERPELKQKVFLDAAGLTPGVNYTIKVQGSEAGTKSAGPDGTVNFLISEILPKGTYSAVLYETASNTEVPDCNKQFEVIEQTPGTTGGTGGCTNCTQAAGDHCTTPLGGEGINTAIGCVPTEPQALIQGLMKVGTGAAGAIALLLMIGGAFQMITSAGNAETLKKGQQQFTSAIIGLLFIIFSILLLQVIGVDILQIPGFGK